MDSIWYVAGYGSNSCSKINVISTLLQYKANVDIQDDYGWRAFGMLLVMDQIHAQYKANMDIQDDYWLYGWTAFGMLLVMDPIHALK